MLYIISFLLLLVCACTSQPSPKATVNEEMQKKTITIHFTIDDSTVDTNDNFKLFFINASDTQTALINNNKINLPNLTKDTGYTVCISYRNYNLIFQNFTKKMIIPDQDMEWDIGVDNKIINNLKGLLTDEEFKNKSKYKQLQFFQFNPHEHGDGIQFVKKIE